MLFIFQSKESLTLSKWLGSPSPFSPVAHKDCPCKLVFSRVVHSDFDMDRGVFAPPPIGRGTMVQWGDIRFLKGGGAVSAACLKSAQDHEMWSRLRMGRRTGKGNGEKTHTHTHTQTFVGYINFYINANVVTRGLTLLQPILRNVPSDMVIPLQAT